MVNIVNIVKKINTIVVEKLAKWGVEMLHVLVVEAIIQQK
jgi:hypothetical protein